MKKRNFTSIGEEENIECPFNLKYRILDSAAKVSFISEEVYDAKKKEYVIYTPIKINFSNIMISGDLALVFAQVIVGVNESEYFYYFELKWNKFSWEIIKRKTEFR